jgi:hypothetical protein
MFCASVRFVFSGFCECPISDVLHLCSHSLNFTLFRCFSLTHSLLSPNHPINPRPPTLSSLSRTLSLTQVHRDSLRRLQTSSAAADRSVQQLTQQVMDCHTHSHTYTHTYTMSKNNLFLYHTFCHEIEISHSVSRAHAHTCMRTHSLAFCTPL